MLVPGYDYLLPVGGVKYTLHCIMTHLAQEDNLHESALVAYLNHTWNYYKQETTLYCIRNHN